MDCSLLSLAPKEGFDLAGHLKQSAVGPLLRVWLVWIGSVQQVKAAPRLLIGQIEHRAAT